MKKTIILTIIYSIFSVYAQTSQPIDRSSAREGVGSPIFTEKSLYNSWDFCGSPLGLFEKDSAKLMLNLGMRSTSWHEAENGDSLQQSATTWSIPNVLFGRPGIAYFGLHYTPTSIIDQTRRSTSIANSGFQRISLPLQRFGLLLALQSTSKLFQFSVRGDGYYGDEGLEGSQNSRLIMGLERLSAAIGSRVHPLLTLGMQGGAIGKLDSLRDKQTGLIHDRYFYGQIPQLGWYADFGGEDFPVSSDFSLAISTHRFVYVTHFDEDRDPIKGDSLAWRWQTIGNIKSAAVTWHPALYLAYWSAKYQQYLPTVDNNNLDVGQAENGKDWKTSNITFGLGGSSEIGDIVSVWCEYAHASLSLDYGEAWKTLSAKQNGYDRIMTGIETAVNKIDALGLPPSMELFVRLGYFNQTENGIIDAFESEQFGLVNSVDYNTMMYRYTPDLGWGPDTRVVGLTIGAGATLWNRLLSLDTHLAFLSKSSAVKTSGLQFGLDCVYSIR